MLLTSIYLYHIIKNALTPLPSESCSRKGVHLATIYSSDALFAFFPHLFYVVCFRFPKLFQTKPAAQN